MLSIEELRRMADECEELLEDIHEMNEVLEKSVEGMAALLEEINRVRGENVMCEECWQTPCHPACPNADPPRAVFICSGCGAEIVEGEDYWDLVGEQFCEDCVREARHEAEWVD